jgi:probable HAF family extracellular repeat protein
LRITNGTQTRAFLWDKHNGMQDLGTLGGPDAWAAFVNERGQVSGISFTSFTPNANNGPSCAPNVPGQDPFFWEKGTGMIDIGSFGGTCGAPQAMNNRGQVVGGSYLAGNGAFHPFLWDRHNKPSLIDLGTFGGDNGLATWINESEQIVGSGDSRETRYIMPHSGTTA